MIYPAERTAAQHLYCASCTALRRFIAQSLALSMLTPLAVFGAEPIDDPSKQAWFNYIMGFPKSETLYLEYDVESAAAVSADEPWATLYGTGLAEYYPNSFFDLSSELVTGITKQTSDEDSFEATIRLGVRLHLLNQIFNSPVFDKVRSERFSGRRFSIANLARIEARNFWYSGNRASESDLRFRDRIETKLAINRPTLTDDGVWYVSADMEWFVPLGSNDIAERFATKRRVRIGLGYRQSYRWRFELLAMKDRARETIEEDASVDAYMLDLRVKRYF